MVVSDEEWVKAFVVTHHSPSTTHNRQALTPHGARIASRMCITGAVNEIVAFVRSSASGREAASATILILGDRDRGESPAHEL